MKPNKDEFFDTMDIDRDWIHTEVLGNGKKKSSLISNITVILVILCTILLLFIAFKDMFKKQDLSGLDNMAPLTQAKQQEADAAKAQADAAAKVQADAAAAAKAAEDQQMIYTVKAGDTLAGVGAQFNVDFKTIADANGLKDPYALEVGQQLKIPGVKKPGSDTTTNPTTTTTPTPNPTTTPTTTTPTSTVADSGQTYTVKAGDILSAIAAQYGVTYQAIADLNGMKPPYGIEIGTVLKIPKK